MMLLQILVDGRMTNEWEHNPAAPEADYTFSAGGMMGVVTVVRLARSRYEYSLDIPGEVMDKQLLRVILKRKQDTPILSLALANHLP
jgi:hypothetical protein